MNVHSNVHFIGIRDFPEKKIRVLKQKHIICEGSIASCSKAMGINGAGVEASIAKWNKAVKAGKDADFGRETLVAIGEGPYHIVEQKGRYQTTLGGLKADAQMRILREDGKPIGNLYGAGSVVGGANENTNGLLRQYFPKGQSLEGVTEEELQRAVDLLNNRPRQILDHQTPLEVFNLTSRG